MSRSATADGPAIQAIQGIQGGSISIAAVVAAAAVRRCVRRS